MPGSVNAAAAAFVLAPALALGSFLTVVVARVPARRSIVRPPSSCGTCSAEILRRDNIPLLSYAVLRGRCRHCDAPISPVYPLVEAVTALLVMTCLAVFGATPEAALAVAFCALLVALSVIDARHRIVPNRIVVPAAGVALAAHTAIDPSVAWLVGAVAGAGLLLVVLAHSEGLAVGDPKLAFLVGAMLGPAVTVALAIGLFAALVSGAVLVSRCGTSARKMGVPLVPCLSLGAVVALFWGEVILDAFLGLI